MPVKFNKYSTSTTVYHFIRNGEKQDGMLRAYMFYAKVSEYYFGDASIEVVNHEDLARD